MVRDFTRNINNPEIKMLKSRQLFKFGVNYCRISYSQKVNASQSQNEGITISDNCARKLKQLCESNNNFLRLCVESGGCSGFQYKFDLDDKIADDDRLIIITYPCFVCRFELCTLFCNTYINSVII